MFVIDMVGGITWKLSQLRFNPFSTLVLGLATLRYKLLYTLSGKLSCFLNIMNSPTLLTPSMYSHRSLGAEECVLHFGVSLLSSNVLYYAIVSILLFWCVALWVFGALFTRTLFIASAGFD